MFFFFLFFFFRLFLEVEDIFNLKPLIATPGAFEMVSGFCVCFN